MSQETADRALAAAHHSHSGSADPGGFPCLCPLLDLRAPSPLTFLSCPSGRPRGALPPRLLPWHAVASHLPVSLRQRPMVLCPHWGWLSVPSSKLWALGGHRIRLCGLSEGPQRPWLWWGLSRYRVMLCLSQGLQLLPLFLHGLQSVWRSFCQVGSEHQ